MPIQLLPALITQSAHAKTARVKVITQAAAKAIIVANQTPSHSNRTKSRISLRSQNKWRRFFSLFNMPQRLKKKEKKQPVAPFALHAGHVNMMEPLLQCKGAKVDFIVMQCLFPPFLGRAGMSYPLPFYNFQLCKSKLINPQTHMHFCQLCIIFSFSVFQQMPSVIIAF